MTDTPTTQPVEETRRERADREWREAAATVGAALETVKAKARHVDQIAAGLTEAKQAQTDAIAAFKAAEGEAKDAWKARRALMSNAEKRAEDVERGAMPGSE